MYIYNIRKYERNQMLLTVGCDVTIHTNIGYRTSLGLWAATLFRVYDFHYSDKNCGTK